MKMLIRNISKIHGYDGPDSCCPSILISEEGVVEKIGAFEVDGEVSILDAEGLELSLGWVDMHVHVFDGISDIGVSPDLIGKKQGVSVLVDAGSSGYVNFPGFEKYVIKPSDTQVFAFLNYGILGIPRMNRICDYETDDFIDEHATMDCINKNSSIKGVKVRACKVVLKNRGIEIVSAAKRLARECSKPLMVHIGEPGPDLASILNVLDAGDIVTHCFHGKPGNILSDNKTFQAALDARDRGVLFDVGHGVASFDSLIATECIKKGFLPDLIGSDLHVYSICKGAVSLKNVMAKLEACGIPRSLIIKSVTEKARKVLGLGGTVDEYIGKKADFTLFKIREKKHVLFDSVGNKVECEFEYCPKYVISGNAVIPCFDEIGTMEGSVL